MEEIVVGIDVGTTKVCTLVGRVEDSRAIRILGLSAIAGIRKRS
jgi:cell division protein FtsA